MPSQRVIAVHLLNDLSGSPFVFGQALTVLAQQRYEVHVFTSDPGGTGFLSAIPQAAYHAVPYRWSRYKWLTLLLYLGSQAMLFIRLLFFIRRGDIVYINSMLPFGAAFAARLRGARVVYHIHEVSIRPRLLRNFLGAVIDSTAVHCMYVSAYCRSRHSFRKSCDIIYNALPGGFMTRANAQGPSGGGPFTVLMACSLKKYKGVDCFAACAEALPAIRFELVLNATPGEVENYFRARQLPPNMSCFTAQEDMHPFYARASVVVNLSRPDQWVETFGMTVLEAMYYGKPVVVPPVGGVTELVDDGCEGLYADSRHLRDVVAAIDLLEKNKELYARMARAAQRRARCFTKVAFDNSIRRTFLQFSVSANSDTQNIFL